MLLLPFRYEILFLMMGESSDFSLSLARDLSVNIIKCTVADDLLIGKTILEISIYRNGRYLPTKENKQNNLFTSQKHPQLLDRWVGARTFSTHILSLI
jgi:hypothetical protein